jgi:hypothetical protein
MSCGELGNYLTPRDFIRLKDTGEGNLRGNTKDVHFACFHIINARLVELTPRHFRCHYTPFIYQAKLPL